jgi:hypothetical protein
MTPFLEQLKNIPLTVAWRHAKSILVSFGLVWGSLWYIGGDYATVKADEALTEMLARQGMSPEDFKLMQKQLKEMDIDLAAIRSVTSHANEAIDNIQSQLQRVDAKSGQTYELLVKLLEVLRSGRGR